MTRRELVVFGLLVLMALAPILMLTVLLGNEDVQREGRVIVPMWVVYTTFAGLLSGLCGLIVASLKLNAPGMQ